MSAPGSKFVAQLAKEIAKEFKSSIYLTYDRFQDKKIILEESWHPSSELIILDEIHKMLNGKII